VPNILKSLRVVDVEFGSRFKATAGYINVQFVRTCELLAKGTNANFRFVDNMAMISMGA